MLTCTDRAIKNLSIVFLVIGLTGGSTGCKPLFDSATYDTSRYLSIHQAALDGNVGSLDEQIKGDPKLVDARDYDENTPVHLATLHNRVEAVRFLLEKGANVNAQESAKMTPLHLAAREGFLDVANVLLGYHPDLNIKDSRNWTPLKWAIETDHGEMANLLREHGAH